MSKTVEELVETCEEKSEGFKERLKRGWKTAKRHVSDGVKWVTEHPKEAAVYAALFTGAAATMKRGFRTADRYITARKEQYNKERFVYDHSAGRYLKTNRVLRNDDVRRINELRRRNPDMKMSEAMERLNLLE